VYTCAGIAQPRDQRLPACICSFNRGEHCFHDHTGVESFLDQPWAIHEDVTSTIAVRMSGQPPELLH
jgi:hypothetical protein